MITLLQRDPDVVLDCLCPMYDHSQGNKIDSIDLDRPGKLVEKGS